MTAWAAGVLAAVHPMSAAVLALVTLQRSALAFGLVLFAAVFSGLNALVLWVRMQAEDAALRGARRQGLAS